MTAAIFAAQAGAKSVVVEKNATAGRKLLLTGGGRCNLTHICSIDEFVRIYESGGRFLRHCLYEFSPDETLDFFSGLGVETKAEQDPSSLRYAGAGGCVFPASERAGDVRDALVKRCEELGVQFNFGRGHVYGFMGEAVARQELTAPTESSVCRTSARRSACLNGFCITAAPSAGSFAGEPSVYPVM